MTAGGPVEPVGPLRPVDVAELRRLAQAATPGPWRTFVDPSSGTTAATGVEDADGKRIVYDCLTPGDPEFIAACDPPTVLALLDQIDTLTAENAELIASRQEARNEHRSALRERDEARAALADAVRQAKLDVLNKFAARWLVMTSEQTIGGLLAELRRAVSEGSTE